MYAILFVKKRVSAKEKARKVTLANLFAKEHLRAFLRTSIGRFNKQNFRTIFSNPAATELWSTGAKTAITPGKETLPLASPARNVAKSEETLVKSPPAGC